MKKMFVAMAVMAALLGTYGIVSAQAVTTGQGKTQQVTQQTGLISMETAKQICFKHAGVTEEQVRMKKQKMDYEHGIQVYEIEFYVGNVEYEYDINATTGAIIKFEKEKKGWL